MKIGLLSFDLRHNGSGQSRFLLSMVKGIKKLGNIPIVFSIYIDKTVRNQLDIDNIEYHYSWNYVRKLFEFDKITYRNFLSKNLARLVINNNYCDFYVVLADEAIGVINYIDNYNVGYIAQGDLSLLFLNIDFRLNRKILSTILERNFVSRLRNHSKLVSKYKLVMANSLFTSNLLSFFYEIPISKIVYPPVDFNIFHKANTISDIPPYAIAMLRNINDPMYSKIQKLPSFINLKIVGGGRIKGAENLGFVSDEQLVNLYSNATLNLSPNTKEYYGYSIVESMSCGTPTLAYNNAGARELIINDLNGWVVPDFLSFETKVIDIFKNPYSLNIRENCLKFAQKYSIENSTKSLLNHLKSI
ncbi:MAG: glycosyltransferase family 4 protein [Thermoplasmataceae archaeon]